LLLAGSQAGYFLLASPPRQRIGAAFAFMSAACASGLVGYPSIGNRIGGAETSQHYKQVFERVQ
jgi:hypothetical protein